MAKKLKLDLSNVKQLLFDKGERIALILCGLIAALLLTIGVMAGLGAGKEDHAKNLQDAAKSLKGKIQVADWTPPPAVKVETTWSLRDPTFPWASLSPNSDREDKKRRNPRILPFGDKWQVDFIRGGHFGYEVDLTQKKIYVLKGGKGGGGGGEQPKMPDKGTPTTGQAGGNFVRNLQPVHMVVMSTVFPLRQQVMEFSRELRLSEAEIIARQVDMPKPIALHIEKCEVVGGKDGEWQQLYVLDASSKKDDQIAVAPPVHELLRRTLIDEENPKSLSKYIVRGLVTPLPRLGNVRYPKLDLPGIDDPHEVAMADPEPGPDPIKKPGGGIIMPKNPKDMPKDFKGGLMPKLEGGGQEQQTEIKKWDEAKVPDELKERFLGNYHAFDPFGRPKTKDAKDGFDKGKLDGPKDKFDMPGKDKFDPKDKFGPKDKFDPQGGGKQGELNDWLVRFFDVGLEAGKTYRYKLWVRMENPNYQKRDLVAFGGLADIRELYSPETYTPSITVPGEYAYYAVDQTPEPSPDPKFKPFPPGPDNNPNLKAHQTTIQIHRWKAETPAELAPICDWAIAERVIISRGEFIGRHGMFVKVPVWRANRNGFEIGYAAPDKKKGPKITGPGLPISFQLDSPPTLVDFTGGKGKFQVTPQAPALVDDSATEILILGPDGKLTVRNSRDDSDLENAEGRERIQRLTAYRERLRQIDSQAKGGGGDKGPNMPGKDKLPMP